MKHFYISSVAQKLSLHGKSWMLKVHDVLEHRTVLTGEGKFFISFHVIFLFPFAFLCSCHQSPSILLEGAAGGTEGKQHKSSKEGMMMIWTLARSNVVCAPLGCYVRKVIKYYRVNITHVPSLFFAFSPFYLFFFWGHRTRSAKVLSHQSLGSWRMAALGVGRKTHKIFLHSLPIAAVAACISRKIWACTL